MELARNSHETNNEPIPELNPSTMDKLDSCLQSPFQNVFGQVLYWGVNRKASILFYLLIKNHPLANGNKRMAIVCTRYLYQLSGYKQNAEPETFYTLAHYVANSNSEDKDKVLAYLYDTFKKSAHKIK